MTRIRPLEMDTVTDLGTRARRCAYWETDGVDGRRPGDPEFEKEAWISHVLLEWGVCGQLAEDDGTVTGAAFYAPPPMVPRARRLPTGPVGSDAVLLTSVIEEGYHCRSETVTALIRAVVMDLRARGVKAVEAFGLSDPQSGDAAAVTIEAERVLSVGDGCGARSCMTPTPVLVEHGFTVVAAHDTFPRLRLELDSEHLWKADVEKALDQLFADSGMPLPRVPQMAGMASALNGVGSARSR